MHFSALKMVACRVVCTCSKCIRIGVIMLKLACILLVIVSLTCSRRPEETFGKVVFANILYRHGATTPIKPYPNDPYKNESSWPMPLGQLTDIGRNQHSMLGEWLRNRYAQLLPLEYSVHDIYVSSSDDHKTWMSAKVNLASLYPSSTQLSDLTKRMSIPVHNISKENDNPLAGQKYCEKYSQELNRIRSSTEMKNIDEENSWLYEYLSKMTGSDISSLETVGSLYETLYAEELHNKILPAWTKIVYPDKLKSLAEKNFEIQANNKFLQRLKSGPLLKEIIDHMQLKSKDELLPNRKIWIYSAYDYTIANMLKTLGVFEPHCPPYAATLLIELRINAQNNYVVTMFYKNSTKEPTLLRLPGCVAACPLDQFVTLTKDVIPDDWDFECRDSTLNITLLVLEVNLLIMVALIFWFIGEWIWFSPLINELCRVPQ